MREALASRTVPPGPRPLLRRLVRDESGATAIEYGLIALGIGIAIVAGIDAVGGGLDGIFNDIGGMF